MAVLSICFSLSHISLLSTSIRNVLNSQHSQLVDHNRRFMVFVYYFEAFFFRWLFLSFFFSSSINSKINWRRSEMTFGAYGNAFFGRCLLNKMKFTACIAAHHNNQYRSKRVDGGCTHGERKREEHYSVMGNDGILFYDAHWVIFMFNFQCFGSSVERVSVAICRLLIASVGWWRSTNLYTYIYIYTGFLHHHRAPNQRWVLQKCKIFKVYRFNCAIKDITRFCIKAKPK